MSSNVRTLTPGRTPVAWVRDDQGNPKPLYRKVDAATRAVSLSDGRRHIRSVRDERCMPDGRRTRLPLHSAIRDVRPMHSLAALMRQHLPEAAAIVDDYLGGRITSREDAIDAEDRYVRTLNDWRDEYVRSRRNDADGLFLQLETVMSLGKMIEITYATPTIEDAFPVTILGTVLNSARGIEKELVEELAQIGGDVSVFGAPLGDVRRGERFYNIVPVFAGATILDTEIERFKEIAQRYPEDFGFDLWNERLRAAALAVQRGVGRTIAFGRPQNQIPGLYRNPAIPTENVDFTTSTPADNLAAINTLVANQFAAVNEREDRRADSLAMSPGSFMLLSQQIFNGSNASNVFTMEMIMRANPWIDTVYQIREAKPNADDAANLVKHGMEATEAAINSGGLRVAGTQRNTVVAYRRDADLVEILKGYDLETIVYPPNVDKTHAKVRESTGGLVVHEPATIRIGYEDA